MEDMSSWASCLSPVELVWDIPLVSKVVGGLRMGLYYTSCVLALQLSFVICFGTTHSLDAFPGCQVSNGMRRMDLLVHSIRSVQSIGFDILTLRNNVI